MARKIFFCLFFFCLIIRIATAQSDDITLIPQTVPVYRLQEPFSRKVIGRNGEELTVTVSDIISESGRILVRFFIPDVPEDLKEKITDNTRLYGSYLPAAEIADGHGVFLTPSSASKYSFLEYNSRMIIGGLLVFDTDAPMEAFYLNFNQIPFDTAPLSEGFTHTVRLSPAELSGYTNNVNRLSCTASDIEFTAAASAQTSDVTMLQPAVRTLRDDETFSKFGWISFTDPDSGKRYAVFRENLYGFNLTDDAVYSPGHAYLFNAVRSSSPIEISMNEAYVIRSFADPGTAEVDLSGHFSGSAVSPDEDFPLHLSEISIFPDENRLRIYIEAGDRELSDISFRFPERDALTEPSVYCGIDPGNGKFACDFFFTDADLPRSSLKLEITDVEYLKTGPWTFLWHPVPMDEAAVSGNKGEKVFSPVYESPASGKSFPDEINTILAAIRSRSDQLTSESGWIRESYLLDYTIGENEAQDLIRAEQYSGFYTRYITENWYAVDQTGRLQEILSLTRDPETDEISAAYLEKDGVMIDLIHALKIRTDTPLPERYSCFADFTDICSSSAVFLREEDCGDPDAPVKCLSFYDSLSGTPDGKAYQSIIFRVDPSDSFILSSEIDYDHGALLLKKSTLALERSSMPEDILALTDSIYE